MQFAPAIPILRIFSVDKAREFYLDFLGFQLDWEHRFAPDLPLYMQIHRDGLILHLSEHHGDATPGSAVFARVEDLKALERELLAKRYGYARPQAEAVDWGLEMQVADPFGNRLRFCQQIDNV
ncbi:MULTISPECIES: glyoxalase superfamily protein [Pseudomonas]|uniref:Bleomycin resistance protein n=1 Tax=Pseudomonas soli TaxID=1306993 RepID=A0A2V4IA63_9PSED|nr:MULTISPECIES: glyoxalase superfamily protein [Pseudomonas]MDW9403368.1 VOC family protein [Pseudomonas soli]NBK41023.1 VOC family protein [Pseudomonas soli]PNA01113.1 glyoxalase/bleomycin resistance/extradiol dioxygenase family protein [Pseudomonas sp. FW305-42]PNA25857.1 glyoxalase/bleomycin resistance/extradiol dioxygenase family protein [Pseudomonas sp. MPR-R1B]PNB28033.1 glyoxalase/bleomycin resistance/extradiol dioxygenase family protein [Pseudomonas sp. DP16D-E2]